MLARTREILNKAGVLIIALFFFGLFGLFTPGDVFSQSSSTACWVLTSGDVPPDQCACPLIFAPDPSWTCETNLCPGACGELIEGVYGSQGIACGCYLDSWNNWVCDGNWCNRWNFCCNVCNPGDCAGPTPIPEPGVTNTPVPIVTPVPTSAACSCTGNLTPDSVGPLVPGNTAAFSMNVSNITAGCFVSQVNFFSTIPSVATVAPANDAAAPYATTATVVGGGATQIFSQVIMNDGGVGCIDTSSLTASAPLSPVTLNPPTSTCVGTPTPQVGLTWSASAGATDYRIYRCTGAACVPSIEIAAVGGLTYTDSAVTSGTTYRYSVRAHRASDGVFSGYSNIVTVVPTCPSCNVGLNGSASIPMLDTRAYTLDSGCPGCFVNGTITQVNFSSSNGNIISIGNSATSPVPVGQSSYTDNTSVYNMNATSYSIGSNATLTAGVIMDAYQRCSASLSVGVTNTLGWWQAKEADLVSSGDIVSTIPGGCVTNALCDESLIIYDTSEYPGVAQAGGSVSAGGSGGIVSRIYNWNSTGVPYGGPALNYTYFRNKLPTSVVPQAIAANPVTQAILTAGGTEYPVGSGYYYFEYTGGGDLIISDIANIDIGSRKVVVFAPGSVQIQSKILLQNGLGSFMLVSGGNISVSPTVGGPQEFPSCTNNNCTPDLEGLYFSQGQFRTGAGNQPLHVRGSIAAWDKVLMERDLPDNSLTPAEFFEFGIDQLMLMPPSLGDRKIIWSESAP